jgi:hypothetical protein
MPAAHERKYFSGSNILEGIHAWAAHVACLHSTPSSSWSICPPEKEAGKGRGARGLNSKFSPRIMSVQHLFINGRKFSEFAMGRTEASPGCVPGALSPGTLLSSPRLCVSAVRLTYRRDAETPSEAWNIQESNAKHAFADVLLLVILSAAKDLFYDQACLRGHFFPMRSFCRKASLRMTTRKASLRMTKAIVFRSDDLSGRSITEVTLAEGNRCELWVSAQGGCVRADPARVRLRSDIL